MILLDRCKKKIDFLKRVKHKQQLFENSMFINDFIKEYKSESINTYNETNEDKIQLYEFAINSILEDLQAFYTAQIIYSKEMKNSPLKKPIPTDLGGVGKTKKIVNLKDDIILVKTWKRKNLLENIIKMVDNEFIYDKKNHFGFFYSYLNFGYVYNGNHSITAGKYRKKGIIELPVINCIELFDKMHTDGAFWYSSLTGEKIEETIDYRLGLIFELAKIKYNLEKSG